MTSKIFWVDLDNTPHVPFFRPIIDNLRRQGHEVMVTARDAYNVVDLLKLYRLDCTVVGRHFGRNKVMKVAGLLARTAQLLPVARARRPDVAVSHGSRAQILAAKILRLPSVVIADYEHVTHLTRPDVAIVPEVMPADVDRHLSKRVKRYPGIKEDVYANDFVPDESLRKELGLGREDIVVTFRPPATEAHYHRAESDELSAAALEMLLAHDRTKIVLLPRNEQQHLRLASRYAHHLGSGKIIIPARAVDGLNLVWHSDLVVSGGGTMNREAAALGVPVYSTFRGPVGAVDDYLSSAGRLTMLKSVDDVRDRIRTVKRDASGRPAAASGALHAIVAHILAASAPSSVHSGRNA